MNSKFGYYLRKVKTLPHEMLIKKVFCKIKNRGLDIIAKISANIFDTEITDAEFLRTVWSSNYQFKNPEELAKYFRGRKEPKFFIGSSRRENIVSLIYKYFSYAADRIVTRADKICEHIFDLLGSGPVKVYHGMRAKGFEGHCYDTQISGDKLTVIHHSPFVVHNYKPIDWHIDFKSGYRWSPKTCYKDIKYGHRPGVDIKVPWELSRFQHLTTLGEAYFLSRNKKYAKEFISQVADWIEHNPSQFGVNWACTMDVAIRACNWILAWEFFRNSLLISNEFIIKFFKSVLQHGRHIRANLESSEVLTSNHYLSHIVGLVYLGVLIPEFGAAKKWREFGIKELIKEMEKQVDIDGADLEGSSCYHRLVLELFFFATLLVVINESEFNGRDYREMTEKIFGKKYTEKLHKMFETILYLLKPNGRMPQIGDNDNGRLHIFTKRGVLDMRYLLTLGAIFFEEPKFKIKEFGFCEEALWIFGEKGHRIWQDLKESCLANIGSRAFPDAGWYVMRDNKNYCIISCGPSVQKGNGGHCHNDKLSFESCIDGEDIIVDPGTYVYTAEPEWRNKFRGTVYHNTVMVDNKEQNRFSEKNLFQVENDAIIKCLKWEIGNEIDVFIGEHYGYKRLSHFVIHQREIKFHKTVGKLEIIDRFRGEGKHNLEWNLILSPEFKRNPNIAFSKAHWHRQSAFYSTEYGIITKTQKLTATLKAVMPYRNTFWFNKINGRSD